jgi:hypothetical protein
VSSLCSFDTVPMSYFFVFLGVGGAVLALRHGGRGQRRDGLWLRAELDRWWNGSCVDFVPTTIKGSLYGTKVQSQEGSGVGRDRSGLQLRAWGLRAAAGSQQASRSFLLSIFF